MIETPAEAVERRRREKNEHQRKRWLRRFPEAAKRDCPACGSKAGEPCRMYMPNYFGKVIPDQVSEYAHTARGGGTGRLMHPTRHPAVNARTDKYPCPDCIPNKEPCPPCYAIWFYKRNPKPKT